MDVAEEILVRGSRREEAGGSYLFCGDSDCGCTANDDLNLSRNGVRIGS